MDTDRDIGIQEAGYCAGHVADAVIIYVLEYTSLADPLQLPISVLIITRLACLLLLLTI